MASGKKGVWRTPFLRAVELWGIKIGFAKVVLIRGQREVSGCVITFSSRGHLNTVVSGFKNHGTASR